VPPAPTVITVTAPGVVEIVEVPETVPLERVAEPVTKTSPAPPPPARLPNPPPPPPPTTTTSIAVTPVGVDHTQLPTEVILTVVNPFAVVDETEQADKDVAETVALPPV
jgi:hypothetical protein